MGLLTCIGLNDLRLGHRSRCPAASHHTQMVGCAGEGGSLVTSLPELQAAHDRHLQFTHRVQKTIPMAFKLSTPCQWRQVTPTNNDSIFYPWAFSKTRPHSGCPGRTRGSWPQTPIVRVSWHSSFQGLSSSVAVPLSDLWAVQNNSFPRQHSTSTQFQQNLGRLFWRTR